MPSMLHTVNKSPLERHAFESCLQHAADGAVIVLIEDGVYGAMTGTAFTPRLQQALQTVRLYALAPDVEARGIRDKIADGVTLIDYGGFVDLVTQHSPVLAWL
jgi:tRNA 2-thiouridine synthesizing protein B